MYHLLSDWRLEVMPFFLADLYSFFTLKIYIKLQLIYNVVISFHTNIQLYTDAAIIYRIDATKSDCIA